MLRSSTPLGSQTLWLTQHVLGSMASQRPQCRSERRETSVSPRLTPYPYNLTSSPSNTGSKLHPLDNQASLFYACTLPCLPYSDGWKLSAADGPCCWQRGRMKRMGQGCCSALWLSAVCQICTLSRLGWAANCQLWPQLCSDHAAQCCSSRCRYCHNHLVINTLACDLRLFRWESLVGARIRNTREGKR